MVVVIEINEKLVGKVCKENKKERNWGLYLSWVFIKLEGVLVLLIKNLSIFFCFNKVRRL